MKKAFSLIYKIILIGCALYGVSAQLGILTGNMNLHLLNYFTILSNLLIAVYFIIDVISLLCANKTFMPVMKYASMMAIILTGVIAHFILGMSFSMSSTRGLSLLLCHYIVPIMSVLDYLIFDKKGTITPKDPMRFTYFPLAYFAYVMIAVHTGHSLGMNSAYPYPFMNLEALGWPQFTINIMGILACYLLLSYGLYRLDRLLKKH